MSVHDALGRRAFLKAGAGVAAIAAGGPLLDACGGSASSSSDAASTGAPKRGGTIHAGFSGGSSSDTLDPLNQTNSVTSAYAVQIFDSLVAFDREAQPQLQLAQEITPSTDAKTWTIRVKQGVTFHDGRELTADDVIYTLERIANPKHPAVGAPQLSTLVASGLRRVDKYTAEVQFATPYATFPEALATYFFPIIPTGFTPTRPVGTGPFKYESFTPGEQLSLARNADYWISGLPHVDHVVLTDVADETAQVNGLGAGQFDIIDYLSAPSIDAVQSGGNQVMISSGGGWNPFTMRCDQPPFSDVRVRQAFRLIVDRPALRDTVFAGHGALGNDLYALYDPVYDDSLPQRHQDLEQAKALLRQAGHSGLSVQLVTSPIAQGVVGSAQVFAQQASQAGVHVSVRQVTATEFFGPNYLKWLFSQDVWYYNPFFPQIALSDLPTAAFNETHFSNARFAALYRQALATVDAAKRTELAHEMQQIYYNESGYIIPCFTPTIDGYSKRVGGVVQSKIGLPFNNYDLKSLWLT
jgi:peptide/nickel transport system substrate-binding protein